MRLYFINGGYENESVSTRTTSVKP
ncbi:Protein of unknown function [Bacillus cereus]|nr:Protein of unknown function [Bacillus cereus]